MASKTSNPDISVNLEDKKSPIDPAILEEIDELAGELGHLPLYVGQAASYLRETLSSSSSSSSLNSVNDDEIKPSSSSSLVNPKQSEEQTHSHSSTSLNSLIQQYRQIIRPTNLSNLAT